MNELIIMNGQWAGFFTYGAGYPETVQGCSTGFRLFLEDTGNCRFAGTAIDLEGTGSLFEQSVVTGFTEGRFISFTKTYRDTHYFNEDGSLNESVEEKNAIVQYEGEYNASSNCFNGTWEIWANYYSMEEQILPEVKLYLAGSGTWEMRKDD